MCLGDNPLKYLVCSQMMKGNIRWAPCVLTRSENRDNVEVRGCLIYLKCSLSPRLCIINDELFVRNASPEEIQRAFAMPAPAPTPSSSPVPTLSPEQQEMLQAFSTQSGMNLEWSQK